MRRLCPFRTVLAAALCVALGFSAGTAHATTKHKKKSTRQTAAASGQTSTTRPSTHSSSSASKGKKHTRGKSKKSSRARGQAAIDSERTQQIQEALIREHYLTGTPSGKWDDATQSAMRRFQSDQGWQSKTVPDSRALIKLGLGPSHDHLLNPETAMTTAPVAPKPSTKPATADPLPANPAESTPSPQQ